jgi:hypothetical protein
MNRHTIELARDELALSREPDRSESAPFCLFFRGNQTVVGCCDFTAWRGEPGNDLYWKRFVEDRHAMMFGKDLMRNKGIGLGRTTPG